MKPVKLIASVSTLAILAVLAVNVGAQQTNVQDRTFLTFSTAVEMPGVVLEPGTYEFRLADVNTRDVVQVYRKDANDIVGQWTFVQSQRERVGEETVVMFRETAEGTTPAIQYWYYPGERIGKEFIYPKDQAERIAARTGQPVRADDGTIVGDQRAEQAASQPAPAAQPGNAGARAETTVAANPDGVRVEADARATDADRADAAAPDADQNARQQPSAAAQPTAPAGSTTGNRGVAAIEAERAEADASVSADRTEAEASVAADARDRAAADADAPEARAQVAARQQPAEPRPVGTTGTQQPGDGEFRAGSELPRTASPLALTGLIGLLSLAGAMGLRRFSR